MLASVLAGLALATPTVDCSARAEAPAVSPGERREALRVSIAAPGAIFWGLRNARHQRFGGDRRPGYKAGLSVFAGRPLTVSIATRDRDWLALNYGRFEKKPVLRLEPCAPDTQRFSDGGTVGSETSWAGGFTVDRPGCATLRVKRAGETRWTSLRVAFGVRCRG